jgi:hypothetical protein
MYYITQMWSLARRYISREYKAFKAFHVRCGLCVCVCVLYHVSHYNMLYYIVQGVEGLPRAVRFIILYHTMYFLSYVTQRLVACIIRCTYNPNVM